MSAKPRLLMAALLAAAVALGAYAATRPGTGTGTDAGRASGPSGSAGSGARPERPDGGEADPTAALDAALSGGRPVYVLARSET